MACIRKANTKPEMVVRRALRSKGVGYRLHRRDLPGTPDIVLPSRKTAIFVHGCFWHRHPGCRYAYSPKSRTDFWQVKFLRNVERDRQKVEQLEMLGWNVKTIWECETRNHARLDKQISQILKRQD